jgi:imidazolonepropionase
VRVPGPAPKRGADLGSIGALARGCVAALDGMIVFVGDARDYRRQVRLRKSGIEIDASGCTVLPGFVDPHTHLPFAGSREDELVERLRGATYEEIAARGGGIMATVRAVRAAGLEALVDAARPRLDRMLLHGTTTAEAKSGYGLTFDDEIKQLQAIRALDALHPIDLVPTFLGAHVVPRERAGDREGYIDDLVGRQIPAVAAAGLARYCDVFIDTGAFSVAEGERILSAASACGLGLRAHVEQRSPTGGALMAARLKAASADHLEHASEATAAALAASGTTAVLLPGAAFFLRDPVDPPVRRLVEIGVPIALGTDFNPGTCPTEAMPAILPIACLAYGLDPAEAIAAATLNAAHSLGLADRIGSLEVGKAADIQVVDAPNHRHLAWHFGVNLCRTVVKSGRVVVDQARRADGGTSGSHETQA